MDKSELMIGDWVMIKDHPMKFLPQKFTEQYWTRSLCEFEAIPITREILMKNNITETNCTFYDGYNFEFQNKRNAISIGSIWFVHELQHVLRLVGLNEMADNFII